jgi:bifunctional NMN adenylyltransferase/nudix hydrolase
MSEQNSLKSQTVAVVVGRWQLFHKGHQTLLDKALEVAERVVVVIGSSFHSRDPKNPFDWEERAEMIRSAYGEDTSKRLLMLPVRDYFDDELWNAAVRKGVNDLVGRPARVKLVGFFKDSSSYYLRSFREWELEVVEQIHQLDATELRNVYFGSDEVGSALRVMKPYVNPGVLSYLQAWAQMAEYARRKREHLAVKAYREKWTATAYNTADALVQVGSHVLLIRRGGEIGHGLWALPGGFVEKDETFLTAAIRELKEETNFGVLDMSIRGALKGTQLFDHPSRSPRGRLVTVAHHFKFGDGPLPEVRAADDAKEVRWFHVDELPELESQLFEDHGRIIGSFLRIGPRGV